MWYVIYICTIWNFKNKGGCYMWSEKGGYIHHKIIVKGTLNWCVYFFFLVFVSCSIGTFGAILEWWSSVELDHTFFFAMHWRNFAISVKFRILKHYTYYLQDLQVWCNYIKDQLEQQHPFVSPVFFGCHVVKPGFKRLQDRPFEREISTPRRGRGMQRVPRSQRASNPTILGKI